MINFIKKITIKKKIKSLKRYDQDRYGDIFEDPDGRYIEYDDLKKIFKFL